MTSKYALKYETPRRPITDEDVASIAGSLAALATERALYEQRHQASVPKTEEIQTIARPTPEDSLTLSALYQALPLGDYER